MHEAGDGAAFVARNFRLVEDFAGRLVGPIPDGEDRLGDDRRFAVLFHRLDGGAGDLFAIDQDIRRMHRHDGVIGLVLQHQRQRLAELFGAGVAGQLHRRRAAPAFYRQGGERLARGRRNIRQLAAEIEQVIDGEIADAAPVGDDRQPVAIEWLHAPQRLGGVEQTVNVAHAQDAGAAEGGVIDPVGRRQIARVGAAPARGVMATRTRHDHRLYASRGARGRHEALGVLQMLDVEQDGAGHRIERVDIEHVGEIDIRLVAERGHAGEADLMLGAPRDNRAEHRRRLRNHRQIAGQNRLGGEAGVEFEARRDQAVAIGSEQADAALARNGAHLLEQQIRAGMGIVGHDNGRRDRQVRRLVQNRRYIFLGRHHDRPGLAAPAGREARQGRRGRRFRNSVD